MLILRPTIEGKVDESFGPLLEEWLREASGGKGRLERVPRHVGVEMWMGWVRG